MYCLIYLGSCSARGIQKVKDACVRGYTREEEKEEQEQKKTGAV
jgi:hypothetical protein